LTFEELGLSPQILDGISSMGYKTATPVQSQVIQPILAGRDILASAQTGTGKTAAFLLPIIHKLITEPHPEDQINALIMFLPVN
jgi:superfamily II DNA/RNA helicase